MRNHVGNKISKFSPIKCNWLVGANLGYIVVAQCNTLSIWFKPKRVWRFQWTENRRKDVIYAISHSVVIFEENKVLHYFSCFLSFLVLSISPFWRTKPRPTQLWKLCVCKQSEIFLPPHQLTYEMLISFGLVDQTALLKIRRNQTFSHTLCCHWILYCKIFTTIFTT